MSARGPPLALLDTRTQDSNVTLYFLVFSHVLKYLTQHMRPINLENTVNLFLLGP